MKYMTIGECMDATKGEAYLIFYRSFLEPPITLNCGMMNIKAFRENCSARYVMTPYIYCRPCSFNEYMNHKTPFGFYWPTWKKTS